MVNGAKLAELRKKAGLTVAQLGDKVGVSQPMITHMENELKTPSVEVMVRIAKCLGATVDELIKKKN